jgi:hypothetical protein
VHLVTTELVADAARLGAVFERTISRSGDGAVLIEVRESGPGRPELRARYPRRERARVTNTRPRPQAISL